MIQKFERPNDYMVQSAIDAANARLVNNPSTPIVVFINQPLEGFYTLKDVMDLLMCSKTTAQKLFNMKEFPSCNFGKMQVVSKQAFYEFFSRKQSKEDYRYWMLKKGA